MANERLAKFIDIIFKKMARRKRMEKLERMALRIMTPAYLSVE